MMLFFHLHISLCFYAFLIYFLFSSIQDVEAKKVNNNWNPSKDVYPKVRRVQTAFTYKSLQPDGSIVNVTVPDPYNWLEKDASSSNDTKSFIEEENDLTLSYWNKSQDLDAIDKTVKNLLQYVGIYTIITFGPEKEKKYLYNVFAANSTGAGVWNIATSAEKAFRMNSIRPFPVNCGLIRDG